MVKSVLIYGAETTILYEDDTRRINPLRPELNPSVQRCLTRILLGIFLLEPCISIIYA
jgi:hypothetical protein